MNDQNEKTKPKEEYRWELVENFRKRSDESSSVLRATLLLISSSAIGFIVSHNYDELPNLHLVPVFVFSAAIGFIIWSWDRQKTKSIERLKALRDYGYSEYLELERCLAKYRKNETIDRWSYVLILAGLLSEVAVLSIEKVGPGT